MRTVVITGATSGFGQLIVQEFLKNGDRVVATGRRLRDRTELFAEERNTYRERLIECDLDVTLPTERKALVEFCKQLPQVDILINNAGYGLFGALEDTTDEQVRHQFEVNFFGLVNLTRDLLPQLRESRGMIFNLSSVFGFTGFPMTSVYCASKFAVEGLSESLAYELRASGVQVCLIEPGAYRTKFNSSKVWGSLSHQKNSAYANQTENYRLLFEKMGSRTRFQDPQDVATGILKLSQRRNLPLRAAFGRDALFTKIVRKFAPERLLSGLTHQFVRKMFVNRKSPIAGQISQ